MEEKIAEVRKEQERYERKRIERRDKKRYYQLEIDVDELMDYHRNMGAEGAIARMVLRVDEGKLEIVLNNMGRDLNRIISFTEISKGDYKKIKSSLP